MPAERAEWLAARDVPNLQRVSGGHGQAVAEDANRGDREAMAQGRDAIWSVFFETPHNGLAIVAAGGEEVSFTEGNAARSAGVAWQPV